MNDENRLSGKIQFYNTAGNYAIIIKEDGSKWFANKESFVKGFIPSQGLSVYFIGSRLKGENLALYVSLKK